MKTVKLSWMCGHVTFAKAATSVVKVLQDNAAGNLCSVCAEDFDSVHGHDNDLTDEDIAAMASMSVE